MDDVRSGSLVILHCTNPKEKMWGLVVRLDAHGVVLRGLELASVADWMRQLKTAEEMFIGPTTFFIPMRRVMRIDLDESGPAVEGYGDRFRTDTGRDVREELMATFGPDA